MMYYWEQISTHLGIGAATSVCPGTPFSPDKSPDQKAADVVQQRDQEVDENSKVVEKIGNWKILARILNLKWMMTRTKNLTLIHLHLIYSRSPHPDL